MSNSDEPAGFGMPDPLGLMPDVNGGGVGPFGVPVPNLDGSGPAPADVVEDLFQPPEGDAELDVDDPTGIQPEKTREDSESALDSAASLGEEYIDRVDDALAEEDCELCEQLLQTLRTRPIEEQVKGVQELSELKRALERDAGEDEVEEMLDGFDVLDDPAAFL